MERGWAERADGAVGADGFGYPLSVVFDMETHDPDDYLTLLLLLGHPLVKLKAVTITPGSPYQVGLVRRTLEAFGVDIPVGAGQIDHPKPCVSSWHAAAYGEIAPSWDAICAQELLLSVCDEETTLITGAPLKNLRKAMQEPSFRLGRWVAQGGFAGEGVVPRELQMLKFRGLRSVPTFNFNGDPMTALQALEHTGIGLRRFVSKNVCHRIFYDEALHEQIAPLQASSQSLAWMWEGMEVFLQKKARKRRKEGEVIGKKFHDPLAACCAIDPSIAMWAEVRLFRERGGWGSELAEGSNAWIILDLDEPRFFEVLTASAGATLAKAG